MSQSTVVRSITRPDTADENERLTRAVFAQLGGRKPEGLSYASSVSMTA